MEWLTNAICKLWTEHILWTVRQNKKPCFYQKHVRPCRKCHTQQQTQLRHASTSAWKQLTMITLDEGTVKKMLKMAVSSPFTKPCAMVKRAAEMLNWGERESSCNINVWLFMYVRPTLVRACVPWKTTTCFKQNPDVSGKHGIYHLRAFWNKQTTKNWCWVDLVRCSNKTLPWHMVET